MADTKRDLLDRIANKCDRLEEISASYRRLHQLGAKAGSTQEYLALVDAVGTVTLSLLSNSGNLMQALLANKGEN